MTIQPTLMRGIHGMGTIFTARIRRMREGNIFSLFTLVGGGNPISGPDGGGGVPHPADGGTHPKSGRGYPILLTGRLPPSKIRTGGTPHPRLDGVPLPPHPSSAKRACATRRAVCLLRSRRRTFLLENKSKFITKTVQEPR